MRKFQAIFLKEITTYFVSPIAYVALAVFLALSGFFFVNVLYYTHEASLRILFGNMVITFLFITPLLTMRLFAEEKRIGTTELLFTTPTREVEVVLGKYFASLFIVLLMLMVTLVYPICLMVYGDPDLGPIFSGYLGLLLVTASFLAVGILASSFTKNQIVAALISYCVLLIYWTLSWVSQQVPQNLKPFFNNLSLKVHLSDFLKGIIDTQHIIFYLTVIVFHLILCTAVLDSERWRE